MGEAQLTSYSGWALVEQMGFRKTVGKVCEVEQYGTKMLRLDIPPPDGSEDGWTTRFCGGPSLYQVSPLSETVALDAIKRQADPRPVRPTDYRIEAPRHWGDPHDDDAADQRDSEHG
jgi:hypothetical protein